MMTDRSWAWDRYWHADRIASCMDGAGQSNYDNRLSAGWSGFFETLPPGSRILDLCTGNGAIAAIAAESGNQAGNGFTITGVDLADIDPLKFVSRYSGPVQSVRFLGKINCETLPFETGTFDAVVSQYGIEYSELERSLPETVRVLAPAGRLRLGLHAAEGSVVAETNRLLADVDFLSDEARLCDVAAQCMTAVLAVERNPTSNQAQRAEADRCLAEFRNSLTRIETYLPLATDQRMVRDSTSVLLHAFENRRYFDLSILLAKVEDVRSEILAHRHRMLALIAAAVTSGGAAAIAGRLAGLGLADTGWGEQRADEQLLGYWIEGALPR